MIHQEFESPEALRDTIRCFWYTGHYFGEDPSGFKVVPDGYAEIIFHFGSPCCMLRNGVLQPLPSPFMVGLLNQPIHFYAQGQVAILGIRCFPWTVFDLLDLPSGKDGVRMLEHPMAQLQPALDAHMQVGQIAEAVGLLSHYFQGVRARLTPDSMLYKAGVAMQKAAGTLPVSQVAEAAHATVRTLERNFKRSSGHTVKDVSALMRFEQVRDQLWINPDVNLAGLAHDLGYTDQSHLSREFKRYSGTTPAAFARKIRQGKQLFGNDFVAFIQA